jgi:hypothetical protein
VADGGVVEDETTGLVWQQDTPGNQCPADPSGLCTREHAQEYCQALQLGEYDGGWTLPTIEQLFSLFNYTESPAIDWTVFTNLVSNPYWSSTIDESTNWPWIIYFSMDEVGQYVASDPDPYCCSVRCVH